MSLSCRSVALPLLRIDPLTSLTIHHTAGVYLLLPQADPPEGNPEHH